MMNENPEPGSGIALLFIAIPFVALAIVYAPGIILLALPLILLYQRFF